MRDKTISIIICTRNRRDELVRCLESIATQTRLLDEVLIVDGSDDDQLRALLQGAPFDALPIQYIHTEPGLTRQRNIGIDASHGDIVFFFDDDVILEPDYLAHVMVFYEEDAAQKVGGVQGLDTRATFSWLAHKKHLLYYRFFLLHHNDRTARLLPSGNPTHLDTMALRNSQMQKPVKVHLLSGCMMSFRRQVFQECRFDERFSTYDGEDVDFSHRVAQKHNLYCLPVARLEHRQFSEHVGWYRTQDYWRTSIRAQGYLFDKYLTAQPLNYLAMLWSWLGLLLLHGLVYRNRMAWKGIWQGIGEFLRGDSQGGGILDVG